MKEGWTNRNLGDVCQVIGGGTPSKERADYYSGDIPWATVRDMRQEIITETECKITKQAVRSSATNIIPEGNVVIATRVGLGKVCLLGQDTAINQDLRGIIPNDTKILEVRFLFWWLKSIAHLIEDEGTGATVKGVRLPFIKSLQMSLPPLPEQQRIVDILGEAFDGIATARANAQKNLQNAGALFESHLEAIFSRRSKGWMETTLGAEVDLLTGFPFKSSQYTKSNESVRLLRGDNIIQGSLRWDDVKKWPVSDTEQYNRYHLCAGDVVLAMDRPWVNAGLKRARISSDDLPCLLVQRTARLRGNDSLDNRFLAYLISSQSFIRHILGAQTGIGVPHISGEQIKDFRFWKPPEREQIQIAEELDKLSSETKHLKSIFQQKLAALDELKKSLLQRAFAGELTSQLRESVVIPFPIRIPEITTTDLHAGILAIAYQLHENKGRLKHYGHVKAEKIAHMIEAYVGIDLGRTPVKDAAGPNDYRHLKGVEHRARKAGFFDFQRGEEAGYRVKKHRRFEELVKRTREKLGDRSQDVDRLLELMLPMNTQQAEIFCTVYAAWNNLLLEGQQPTEESIVTEARENWHTDKLKIPREKFFAAIDWLRRKSIIPTGRGKKVTAKA